MACRIFLDKESKLCPCISRQILNHWIAREVLFDYFFEKIDLFIFLFLSHKSCSYILDKSPLSEMYIMNRKVPIILCLLRDFTVNECYILSNAFPVSVEMITWFFFFILLNYINLYSNVKLTSHSWNKPHLIMIIILPYGWAQFAKILLRTSISYVLDHIGQQFGGIFL